MAKEKKLSVIMPVYNEIATIGKVIKIVAGVPLPLAKEIIIIDDCSTDGTREFLRKINDPKIRVFFQERNRGKGAALKRGFQEGNGDIFIVQDADLEYDPADYPRLLKPVLDGTADVVYGSRFHGEERRVLFFWHYLGNKILTFFSNMFTNLNLTDMETGYKAFKRAVVMDFKDKLSSARFGFEPEVTAIVARKKWIIFEVDISYYGRTYGEGKKINWKDGMAAFWHIIKFNVFCRK